MINTPGTNDIIIGDSDALIALLRKKDVNHQKAIQAANYIKENKLLLVFPTTTIAEVLTTIVRKLNDRKLAKILAEKVSNRNVNPLQNSSLLDLNPSFQSK